MNGKKCSYTDFLCSVSSPRISFFPFSDLLKCFSPSQGAVCAFRHWNCTMAQSNITSSFTAHLGCQCFFRPQNVFVHNPVANIQAEFSAGGDFWLQIWEFSDSGRFQSKRYCPRHRNRQRQQFEYKVATSNIAFSISFTCKDGTNFEMETFNFMKDIYSDDFWQCFLVMTTVLISMMKTMAVFDDVGRLWIEFRGF